MATVMPPALRRIQPYLTLVARLAMAAVLIYSGLTKIHPAENVIAVQAYKLFPDSVSTVIGYGQPYLEIAVGLLLLVGLASRFVALLAALLMLIFIAGIISVWARGMTINCGCFGGGGTVAAGQTHYLREILRDVGFMIIAGWIAVFPRCRVSVDKLLEIEDIDDAEPVPADER